MLTSTKQIMLALVTIKPLLKSMVMWQQIVGKKITSLVRLDHR